MVSSASVSALDATHTHTHTHTLQETSPVPRRHSHADVARVGLPRHDAAAALGRRDAKPPQTTSTSPSRQTSTIGRLAAHRVLRALWAPPQSRARARAPAA